MKKVDIIGLVIGNAFVVFFFLLLTVLSEPKWTFVGTYFGVLMIAVGIVCNFVIFKKNKKGGA